MNSSDCDSSSTSGNNNAEDSPEDNTLLHNDCSKLCSVPVGGARSKVKQHICNIPNGSAEPVKLNNISSQTSTQTDSEVSKFCPTQNCPSASYFHNSNEKKINGMDLYMTNNVDSHDEVDKCPSKVKNGPIEDNICGSAFAINGFQKQFSGGRGKPSYGDDESSSGNEGEEGFSADDCCIYTYKGDQFADLPNSFFRLDMIANGIDHPIEGEGRRDLPIENERNNISSSPEMDFLEMDFDPGPSLEQDSEEEYEYERHLENENNVSVVPELPSESAYENNLNADHETEDVDSNNVSSKLENDLGLANSSRNPVSPEPQAGPSNASFMSPFRTSPFPHSKSTDSNINTNISSATSRTCWPARDSWGHHCTSGDLCSPGDASEVETLENAALWNAGNMRIQGDVAPDTRKYNMHSALYHCIMAKRLVMDKQTSFTEEDDPCVGVVRGVGREPKSSIEKTMIWSEQEACHKQVTQISTSACGATAVINVMIALNTPFSLEKIKEGVATKLRAESAPLPAYLFSRSVAGATHEDIIRGIHHASNGSIFARFFHMYPERDFSLSKWLSYWMKKGAIPLATLNLQAGVAPENPIPDAWHHQMIFGVSSRGIYLTNPVECVQEDALWSQLCSPSVLKIKRGDVLSRWTPNTDLKPLMCKADCRWKKMNVLGQIVNMVRENMNSAIQGRVITQHISIPAAYYSGVTLVIPKESPGYEDLLCASELPEYVEQQE